MCLSGPTQCCDAGQIHLQEEHQASCDVDHVDDGFVYVGECGNDLLADCKHSLLQHVREQLQEGVFACQEVLHGSQLDLLEVCAPWDSPLTAAVSDEGGRAMAIGPHNGFDLTKRSGFRKAAQLVREKRLRYLHISPPCWPWTSLQNCNQKYPYQVERLNFVRRQHKSLLHHCRLLAEIQVLELNSHCSFDEGAADFHHAGVEHPLRAVSWGLADMRVMVRLCGGERFRVDGCRHGLVNRDTRRLFQKPWGWCTTHANVRKALELHCNHPKDSHDHVCGKYTAGTVVYPYLLRRRFARALMKDIDGLFSVFSQYDQGGKVFAGDDEIDSNAEIFSNFDDGEPAPDEPVEVDAGNDDEPVPPGENAEPSDEPDPPRLSDAEIQEKLRTIHRNLGHPCKSTLLRMLKDAGAGSDVLTAAENFERAECLQRGHRASAQTVSPVSVREKWHTVSVDTFWWRFPDILLKKGEQNKHVAGLSMFDEATDFHAAVIIRAGVGQPMHNISGDEFVQAFSEGWLQRYPAPSVFRYDEEGCLRNMQVKDFLELFGMKLELISGEAPRQMGKHSRHLQTLKETMSLLAMELGTQMEPHQILSLALSSKNSLHNVRGYSPHQWAFGREHSRMASFLQSHDILPLQSSRAQPDFEEALQAETKARKVFLEADSKRRLARALRYRCRPLQEFQIGQLVYYFRKGRKAGSRYGGKWHAPARVLCHEKTTVEEGRIHQGSVVWISHAGVFIRCSPEQLRHVTRDLRSVDLEINGPRAIV